MTVAFQLHQDATRRQRDRGFGGGGMSWFQNSTTPTFIAAKSPRGSQPLMPIATPRSWRRSRSCWTARVGSGVPPCLDKEQQATTLVPCTEKSGGRSGTKPETTRSATSPRHGRRLPGIRRRGDIGLCQRPNQPAPLLPEVLVGLSRAATPPNCRDPAYVKGGTVMADLVLVAYCRRDADTGKLLKI